MKKYLRTIIALIIFVIFTAATILTYMSDDYVQARDRLKSLNSDFAKHSLQSDWHRAVEHTEAFIKEKQKPCLILAGFAILSLGSSIVLFVLDRKRIEIQDSLLE